MSATKQDQIQSNAGCLLSFLLLLPFSCFLAPRLLVLTAIYDLAVPQCKFSYYFTVTLFHTHTHTGHLHELTLNPSTSKSALQRSNSTPALPQLLPIQSTHILHQTPSFAKKSRVLRRKVVCLYPEVHLV